MTTATTVNKDRIKLHLAGMKMAESMASAYYHNQDDGLTPEALEAAAKRAAGLYFRNPTAAQIDQLVAEFGA